MDLSWEKRAMQSREPVVEIESDRAVLRDEKLIL
jgi:hypothetical protein